MLLYRWDPMVNIVSVSYVKINYWLKLYYLKGCVIMTFKQEGGGFFPIGCGYTGYCQLCCVKTVYFSKICHKFTAEWK